MGWEIMMGNRRNHRCHAEIPGLKNTEKKAGVCWSLDKTGDRKRKKIEKSDSVMQFHPRGKVGKYHTILPQKNVDQNTYWFKNKGVEESKEMTYKSRPRMSIPLHFIRLF